MRIVELFSGCGGLAYGLSRSGFKPVTMIEADAAAFATLEANRAAGVQFAVDWPVTQFDVRRFDWDGYSTRVRMVAGGPPCQPFSQAGKGLGERDERDMWPEAVRAVREIGPEGFLFENVRGLLRPVFANYVASLLETLSKCDSVHGYAVDLVLVDAADFGAPQRRHRVIVAGVRKDVSPSFAFPSPTHSRDRLLWDQWVSRDYWTEHDLPPPGDDAIMPSDRGRVARLRASGRKPGTERWRTVRDAIADLGEPNGENHHEFQPGARSYPGHTGSAWDQPAKALKAGMHGVPGGENMLRYDDGTVRYFTVREMARLHGFPDEYLFPGNRSQNTKQLGNAVPVDLAAAFGHWMGEILEAEPTDRTSQAPDERRQPALPLFAEAVE